MRTDPKVIAAYLGVDDEAEIDMPEILDEVAAVKEAAAEKGVETDLTLPGGDGSKGDRQ